MIQYQYASDGFTDQLLEINSNSPSQIEAGMQEMFQLWGGMMKIAPFWDLFYHLESVPKIKCRGILVSGVRCQVSGVRFRVSGVRFRVSGFRYLQFVLTLNVEH
jgi:hypothetical protein